MARRGGIRAIHGLAALTVATIIGGLWISGGPMQGRAERRDATRASDISALINQADCLASQTGALSADLAATQVCTATPRLADPYTNEPYRIELIDDRNLRLCASFETMEEGVVPEAWLQLDEGGCVVHTRPEA